MKWDKKKDLLALMVGHGKSLDGSWDPGCTYGQYTEAGLMLEIVKEAVKLLRKSGVKVVTDADDANNRNMKSSVAWANNRKAKLYMSVHCDWSKAPEGIYPQVKTKADTEFANAVGKKVASLMGMKYRGVCKRPETGIESLYELNAPTAKACCVFETGSVKADLKKLRDSKAYGKALAKGILKYIGVPVYVSNRTKLLRKMAELLAYMNAHGFTYLNNYKKCGMSWKAAKKTKKSNCATVVSWAAQEVGLLEPGQIFWIAGTKIECRGKGCKTKVKKNFTIKHPKKVASKVTLKAGYVVGYSPYHTQVYVKKNKDGKPMWYSYGKHDPNKKQPRRKATYDKKKLMTVMIPK